VRSRTEGAGLRLLGRASNGTPFATANGQTGNNYQRPMRTPVGGARRTPRGGEEQRDERHIGRGECRYVSTTQ
jgi:hypothetical protein